MCDRHCLWMSVTSSGDGVTPNKMKLKVHIKMEKPTMIS